MSFIPSSQPATRIDQIWTDYRRGLLSPTEMIAAQNAELRPCIEHPNRPGVVIVMEQLRCVECYERLRHEGAV